MRNVARVELPLPSPCSPARPRSLSAGLPHRGVCSAPQAYIAHFQFQSIDTATFLAFLHERLPSPPPHVDLAAWIDAPGLPPDHPVPRSAALDQVKALAAAFPGGTRLTEADHRDWQVSALAGPPPERRSFQRRLLFSVRGCRPSRCLQRRDLPRTRDGPNRLTVTASSWLVEGGLLPPRNSAAVSLLLAPGIYAALAQGSRSRVSVEGVGRQ